MNGAGPLGNRSRQRTRQLYHLHPHIFTASTVVAAAAAAKTTDQLRLAKLTTVALYQRLRHHRQPVIHVFIQLNSSFSDAK